MITIGQIGGCVRGQPDEVARRLRRARPQCLGVHTNPRDDAADQGHEQQQVDRGEPWRAIDLEKAEPVVDGPQRGMFVDEIAHPDRRHRTLRHQRAGNRGKCQGKQQDQRGTHRGELGPQIAQSTTPTQLGQVGPPIRLVGLGRQLAGFDHRHVRSPPRQITVTSDHCLKARRPLPQYCSQRVPSAGDQ